MAIGGTTPVFTGRGITIWEISSSADGDTNTGNLAHGLRGIPEEVYVTELTTFGVIAGWHLTTRNATNLVLTKQTTTGSGNAAVQIRVVAKRAKTFRRPA